jgi:hypothetical protein
VSAATTHLPLIVLVAVNLVPLFGVLFLGWQVVPLLILYWTESAAVGLYNVLKMLRIGGAKAIGPSIFFTVHFGFFMFVHLGFLGAFASMSRDDFGGPFEGVRILAESGWELRLAAASFFASHGVSFLVNFLGKREWEGKTVPKQMMEPYRRIVVMHVTIIFGGFALMALNAGALLMAFLVILKTAIDVVAHRREHGGVARTGAPGAAS